MNCYFLAYRGIPPEKVKKSNQSQAKLIFMEVRRKAENLIGLYLYVGIQLSVRVAGFSF